MPTTETLSAILFANQKPRNEESLKTNFIILHCFYNSVFRIDREPLIVRFSIDGQEQRYAPAFLVTYKGMANRAVTVMTRRRLRRSWKKWLPAFKAARAWCEVRGIEYRVETEKTIEGPRLDNAKALILHGFDKIDQLIQRRILGAALKAPGTTLGALLHSVATSPTEVETYKNAIAHMLFKNTICTDLSLPITNKSQIWPFAHRI